MSWLVPPGELTPEQQRAVQLPPTEHRAIVGGPGSGKTQVLLHRARYLRDSKRVDPDRFRIFVFTNVLKIYIRTALRDLGIPESTVTTFDQWCAHYYKTNIEQRLPWDADAKTPDFVAIRDAVQRHAVEHGKVLFDFVMVDEGQDLDERVFSLFTVISHHVTVCLDNKQQIYDKGSNETAILHRLGIRKRNINLIDAFRVCPYLVTVASELIAEPAEREAFRNQTRQVQTERQTPLLFVAASFQEEKEKLAEIVRERQLKNDRIALLLPTNRQVFGFAKGLTEVGLEVEVPEQRGRTNPFPSHDFGSDRPKLMSYHSAKGLTFDSVLLPRLVVGSFARVPEERIERMLFVAVTRATRWCYFSTDSSSAIPLVSNVLIPLVRAGSVSQLTAGASTRVASPRRPDDLDFL